MPAARTGKFCHTEKNLKSAWGAVVDWVNLIAASTGSAAGFDVRPAEVKVQPRILVRRRLPHHRDGVAIRAVFIRCQFGRFQRPRQIDVARAIGKTEAYRESRRERKKVEMLFAHLKRILKLGQLRLRGPSGAHDEFLLAATAQNLRRMAKRLSSAGQLMTS